MEVVTLDRFWPDERSAEGKAGKGVFGLEVVLAVISVEGVSTSTSAGSLVVVRFW